ncbi:splicing factor 3A subunit 2-like [Acanthochromis polyacanthus]|uniref:splicing factor 3A subunit 2-like n=1 Tax=Acanthochromis polyacanthus TaxID=80966 RepID=UPI0022340B0A|nr:splicing factor 3A subunit 2-like [Acanthochromis polyacanthus]
MLTPDNFFRKCNVEMEEETNISMSAVRDPCRPPSPPTLPSPVIVGFSLPGPPHSCLDPRSCLDPHSCLDPFCPCLDPPVSGQDPPLHQPLLYPGFSPHRATISPPTINAFIPASLGSVALCLGPPARP